MKRNFILIFTFSFYFTIYSQVAVNTSDPQGIFHIDAAGNNPTDGTTPGTDVVTDDYLVNSTGVISIGTIDPGPYSVLEVESTKGVRLPRLSSDQITALDAITSNDTSKKNGLVIYNTTTHCINFWASTKWIEKCGSTSCTTTDALKVTGSSSSANTGTTVTFTASGLTNSPTYTWTLNGSVVDGETSSTYSYYVTSEANNTITVSATDECSNLQEASTTLNSSTFTCESTGRYLKAGTSCRQYYNCVYDSSTGTFIRYDYTCTENIPKFNPSSRQCTADSFTCPY